MEHAIHVKAKKCDFHQLEIFFYSCNIWPVGVSMNVAKVSEPWALFGKGSVVIFGVCEILLQVYLRFQLSSWPPFLPLEGQTLKADNDAGGQRDIL